MIELSNIFYAITLSFTVYFIVSFIFKIIQLHNFNAAIKSKNGILLLNLKHVLGVLLFGIFLFLTFNEFRFLLLEFPDLSIIISVCFVIAIIITSFLAFRAANTVTMDSISNTYSNPKHIWSYFPVRIVFLLAYEFYFRGILFFYLLQSYNLIFAIVGVVLLYVLIHVFDTKKEMIGAIPFGIILCLFSYFTNSIWMAFILHIALSMIYEVTLFRAYKLKMQNV